MKWTHGSTGRLALPLLLMLLAIHSTGSLAAKEIYIWTDEDGVQHFSDSPPQGIATRSLEIPDPDVVQGGDDSAQIEAEPSEEPMEEDSLCSRHQERLEVMLDNPDISFIDESGERHPVSDEHYKLLIQESRDYLKLNCQ